METVEFMFKKQHIPGYPPDVTVTRQYIKLGGEWMELHKTADCYRHLITADHTRHFCVGYNSEIHELPPPKIPFMCGHVCDEMKRNIRDVIEKHGEYLTEDTKRIMQEYIAKENTVSWDDGYKGQQVKPGSPVE